ncbi:formate/nitrite transporter family protein [Thermovenabulum gondwanense]|uniref:Putative formate transporter 1 n=1 Tax=Thermovenabulum gondwanense TaxID=520767 RepID=A0A162MD51_9FIRM|nr:formate/nitrite transporter family protein [Thermovenabulum gondwanense]KYO65355.1 putative formate transporter 1 [Thermovenabulum gondwanense]
MEKNFLTPEETAKVLIEVSRKKSRMSVVNMILLGIFAGIYIGLGAQGSITVMQTLKNIDTGLMRFMGAVVFPVGLMMVVLCGAELFTGNNLMVIGLLDKKINFKDLFRNWFVVYFANFIGSVLLAVIIVKSGILNSKMIETAIGIASGKMSLSYSQAILRGTLCNFLVVVAVWMSTAARDVVSKIFSSFFPIMLFVLSGYEHSIANMYFIPLAKFLGFSVSWWEIFSKNLLPVTFGNLIGGAIMVPFVYYYCYINENRKDDFKTA